MQVRSYTLNFVHNTIQFLRNWGLGFWAGEITQQLRVCTALEQTLGVIPNIHVAWLTTAPMPSSELPGSLLS